LLFATLSPVIIRIFATPEYNRAIAFLTPLLLAQIAYGAYFIFGTGLEVTKRTYHFTWAIILAAIVNMVLNVLLIPHLEAFGASLATAAAYLAAAVMVAIIGQRSYPLPYSKHQLRIVCGVLLASYALLTLALGLRLPHIVLIGSFILLSLAGLFIIIFKKDLQLGARQVLGQSRTLDMLTERYRLSRRRR
jgi:O-antigen/teichoic acid export membrane protein